MEWNMVKVNGKVEEVHNAISMKVTIKMIKSMGLEFSLGQVAMFIKENIRKMREMVMEKWCGLMEAHIKVNGVEEFNMAKVKWYSQRAKLKKGFLNIMFSKIPKRIYKTVQMTIWGPQKQVQIFMVLKLIRARLNNKKT